MVIMLNRLLKIRRSIDSVVASDKLKSLFQHHKRNEVAIEDDDYFSQIWNDPTVFRVVFFGSQYDLDSKECCKSEDGTCATMECPHNYRRYGDDIYEHYKEICQE